MSALSNELFFPVHRGLHLNTPQEKTDLSSLGMHWSATPEHPEERATRSLNWSTQRGEVWHGIAPISSVETDTTRLQRRGYAGFQNKDPLNEKEVALKEEAPVKITGVTKYRLKEKRNEQGLRIGSEIKQRTRRYNPPREMKA